MNTKYPFLGPVELPAEVLRAGAHDPLIRTRYFFKSSLPGSKTNSGNLLKSEGPVIILPSSEMSRRMAVNFLERATNLFLSHAAFLATNFVVLKQVLKASISMFSSATL